MIQPAGPDAVRTQSLRGPVTAPQTAAPIDRLAALLGRDIGDTG